jgi:SAM-dependent methyltransferase
MERAGLRPYSFDVVWLCRSMHSAPDPCRRLAALARLLRPGGRLIIVENDFAHHPLLSWPVDFEQQVFNAHALYLQTRSTDGLRERYHAARYLSAWLRRAGLQPDLVRTYVSEDAAPLSSEAIEYWQLFIEWLGPRVLPHLSPEAQARYLDLCNPGSPNYVLASPDAYCVELTTVGCGTAPW